MTYFCYLPSFPTRRSSDLTVVAFLPKWVGYAWAFPRLDHISFGIATAQDAFDHESLDALLWDFMVSYYGSYRTPTRRGRSEEHTSELQSRGHLVCRLLLET